jgi:hypothetical protein
MAEQWGAILSASPISSSRAVPHKLLHELIMISGYVSGQ